MRRVPQNSNEATTEYNETRVRPDTRKREHSSGMNPPFRRGLCRRAGAGPSQPRAGGDA